MSDRDLKAAFLAIIELFSSAENLFHNKHKAGSGTFDAPCPASFPVILFIGKTYPSFH
ncbi:Uncharacterised protein [Mycobacterium tuberculosis]|nr:Uncharacterised protein [Mycobacterium tuberculosis]